MGTVDRVARARIGRRLDGVGRSCAGTKKRVTNQKVTSAAMARPASWLMSGLTLMSMT